LAVAVGNLSWFEKFIVNDDQPGLTDYSAGGVDLMLIRWVLSLMPAERLEQRLNDIISIRELNAGA
jgi:hypothetical protein